MLGCVVGACLGIAPLLESTGCVEPRRSHAPAGVNTVLSRDSAEAGRVSGGEEEDSAENKKWRNIRKGERSTAHLRSDSIRDSRRRKKTSEQSMHKTSRSKSSKKKSKHPSKKGATGVI